jgi:FkbM family methyltransferase
LRALLASLALVILGYPAPAGARQPSVSPPDALGETAPRGLAFEPLYSQEYEESIIRDFFGDRTNGFFLDVGAAWPIRNSNTYYLEHHLGWTGIAVDALREYGPAWEETRPRSRFYSFLVTDRAGTVEPFFRSEQTGVSSYKRESASGPTGKAAFEEIEVPSITLDLLLEQNGVSRVDFVSMDIEGAELMALAGFDIDRFRPELVCIEAKPANRPGIFEYFDSHGYERVARYLEFDQTNYYFARKATEASAPDPYRDAPVAPPARRFGLVVRAGFALLAAHLLPGLLLVTLLRLEVSVLERWVFAAVLGGPVSGVIYGVALVAGAPFLYWVLLAVTGTAALTLRPGRPPALPQGRALLGLLLLFSALGGAYLLTAGRLYRLDPEGSFRIDRAFAEEPPFHARIVEALQSPDGEISTSTAPRAMPYHMGHHLQLAAWERFFGIDPYDGILRVGLIWWLGLLVFAAYLLGQRFGGSPAVALGAAVLLFGGGLGVLARDRAEGSAWSLPFVDASIVSILPFDPLLPALSLFFVGLVCLDFYFGRAHRGFLAASLFAFVALFSVKALLAAQLLLSVVIASALARRDDPDRIRRTAWVFGLASAPFLALGAFLFQDSNVLFGIRPLEIVRQFAESVGCCELGEVFEGRSILSRWGGILAVTALWLAAFLGLRLLAAPGVFRGAFSRSGSLRSTLSWFVLIGFPLALLLRIAPAEPGGRNGSFWFALQSGVVAWFFTAETLARYARRSGKSLALATSAAVLLALPAAVQYFASRAWVSNVAIAIPRAEAEAASAGRALSQPDEVFVAPPLRGRPSPFLVLGGRPVVDDSFVSVARAASPLDLPLRRHAAAHFWSSSDPAYGAWFLSRFNVRWIYNPREVLSPQASGRWANPAFANDGATIYRVGPVPDLPLRIPERIPLGGRGASFFGEEWGPPEGRPRFRRLKPGAAALYLPTNEARALHVELSLATPHASGRLSLGNLGVELAAQADRAELVVPSDEARRGLSRQELLWTGADPLPITAVRLRE